LAIFKEKEVAQGGERTRGLLISFIFSFSPLYRRATAGDFLAIGRLFSFGPLKGLKFFGLLFSTLKIMLQI
jgi:hypothetical protein